MNSPMVDRFNQGIDFDSLFTKDTATRFCVLRALRGRVGHEKRLSGNTLVSTVGFIWYMKVGNKDKAPSARKVRNTIRSLRRDGALILSTGGRMGGYWIAESLSDVRVFVRLEFMSRAMDLLITAKRITESAQRKFGGQEYLWDLWVENELNKLLLDRQ